jgi:hypothetical protein
MTLRWSIFGMMALCLMATSVLADEVLYCTDTAATGFLWKNGAASTTDFNPERFTITVKSDALRIVTSRKSDATPTFFRCTRAGARRDQIVCDDGLGGRQWVFYKGTYVRTFTNGPPAGDVTDPNIMVGYGICTKF